MKSYHRTCKTVLSPVAAGREKKGGSGVPHATFPTIVEIVTYAASRTIVSIATGFFFGSGFVRGSLWSCVVMRGNIGLLSFAKSLPSNNLQDLTHTLT